LQQEIKNNPKIDSPVLKHEVKGFDRVYTRKMEKHTTEQLKEVKLEPETKYHDEPVEKITNKK
jgi:hypothetical protein